MTYTKGYVCYRRVVLMNKMHLVLAGVMAIVSLAYLFFEPSSAYAASCGGTDTVIVSCGSSENGIWSVLLIAIRILAAGVGIVAVGGIVYAALQYTTAEDNAAQVTTSKNNIQAIIIGIVVFAGMYSFLEFVVPGGVFNRSYSFPVASDGRKKDSDSGEGSGSDKEDSDEIKEARIKVATYNVLGFNHDTSASRYSNNERMERAAGIIKDNEVDAFIATEINTNEQRSLLLGSLSNWGATTRQSGNQDVFIFWNKDVFKSISSGTYNIPVIPGSPSRPQPWIKLEHKDSKRQVIVYGNHLAQTSHGDNQRTGASTTVSKVKSALDGKKDLVAILGGDMNTNDNRGYAYTVFENSGILKDSRHSTDNRSGDNCDTHHDLGGQDCRPTRGSHIDHIWVSKNPKSSIESYRVIANDETAHISDHNPLIVTVKIPATK